MTVLAELERIQSMLPPPLSDSTDWADVQEDGTIRARPHRRVDGDSLSVHDARRADNAPPASRVPEIDVNDIKLHEMIGEGTFSRVHRGTCRQKQVRN